jgi:hypothetical protein
MGKRITSVKNYIIISLMIEKWYNFKLKPTIYIWVLFLIAACQSPSVINRTAGGMVNEDLSGWEEISLTIIRYQKDDTIQYLFTNEHLVNDFPFIICHLYNCYTPKERTGVLGVHTRYGFKDLEENIYKQITSVLQISEIHEFDEIISSKVSFFPLYYYQIEDSFIYIRKMTQEERVIDTKQTFFSIYRKGQELTNYFGVIPLYLNNQEEVIQVQDVVFREIYDVKYKYLNKRDVLSDWKAGGLCANPLPSIPMFYLPLDSNVYYKKNMRNYLVKKRLGFCSKSFSEDPRYNKLDIYSHEIDTALLALPIKIFQEKYLQTKDIYCLDGLRISY